MQLKKFNAIFIILLLCLSVRSQKYGNEWIRYNQTYFKFPIYKEGIYRIDSTVLASKFNLAGINPKNFQLFLNGTEQFMYIKGEADNAFNTGDYIEFYANPLRRNLDSLLYTGINYVPNPYYSLFNDTIYAFITVNSSLTNKRFQVQTDTTIANYPLATHHYSYSVYNPAYDYNFVQEFSNMSSDPRYTQAEGLGVNFNKGASVSTNFSNLSVYTGSALPAYLSIRFSGSQMIPGLPIDHQVKTTYTDALNNSVQLADTLFSAYHAIRQDFNLSNINLGNNSNFSLLSVSNPSFSTFNNLTMLHYVQLFYPKQNTLSGSAFCKMFIKDAVANTKQSFILSNPNAGATGSIVAYDVTSGNRLPVTIGGANARMVVPNSGNLKCVVVCAESNIINVATLYNTNSGNSFTNFKSIANGNAYVIIYHPSLVNSATAYKNYRQSMAGGNYNVLLANINELYEAFSYGVNKHPQAIRNFSKFLFDSLPSPPSYFFLIGKGVHLEDLNNTTQVYNLIPTMGFPSSDNLLTAAITNTVSGYPDIPIGRLAALTNSDVTVYLNKVQQHESVGLTEWKKRVLHFVGGDDNNLTNVLSSYMDSYKQIIEDTLFGANVVTFKKNTTAPIQLIIGDSIKDAINNGASLITFFGHGSDQGFDQAIDDPDAYNNTGKYPMMFANSCYSGNIHIPGRRSVSERFVLANQKGSIGFLATTSIGYVANLNYYSSFFYRNLSYYKYGKGIGDVTKETSYQISLGFDNLNKATALDMALHGDPAIKIYTSNLPDYSIKNSDVKFNTKSYTDSIGLNILISNYGRALNDSFMVRIDRFFPNGDSSTYYRRMKAPFFKDSLKLFVLLDFVRGIGLNKFKIKVDEFNEISEVTKSNNSTIGTVDIFIQGGDIVPVYPYKYAVIPKTNTVTLKASTTDPFAPFTKYKLQLDTNDQFVNPIQQTYISSSGGVIEWTVNLPFADSTVYFWRVSKDSVSPNDRTVWRESSFQTIGSKVGWSQAHFHQFKNNNYRFVSFNRNLRRFDFLNTVHSINVRNGIYPNIFPTSINYFFNNINMSSWGCAPDGWNIAVFDSISGEPQDVVSTNYPAAGTGTYNNCVCVDNQILHVYSFGASNYCGTATWKSDLQNFLNSISPNNYVLAYTMGAINANYAQVTTYSNSLYSAFESFGTGNIRTISDTVPYIIFGKKGMSIGQAHEVIGTKKSDIIYLKDSIKTRWNSGYIASEIIGPSYGWKSLHWQLKPFDPLSGDTTLLKVIGIKQNGQRDTLATFVKDSSNVLALYNYINASTYPYLQLVALMKDNANRTSPQLRKWQVLYDEAPECAINPLKGYTALNDTLQEGDQVQFKVPIENIGKVNFSDSLVISYWIEDNNRAVHPLPQKLKRNNFAPGEVIYDTIKVNTFQYPGNNAIWIDVNSPNSLRYQKEQQHFNNVARLSFKVDRDITNPLLDVTFDGVRILSGDLVSAKPNILVTLKDENKFLALNDTASFVVFLKAPNQSQSQRIYFGNALQFTPANLPNNSCKIVYTPTLITDGVYQLTVQGKDRSNNRSGAVEYNVQFEVNNKPSVTNVLNYPNPFSTSTKFVFTLTGSEIPEIFTIQIMTISGKVVREIKKEELGPLHIGRNITEYSWDGKDDFGDKLGNGVYLYKVITRLNNQKIDHAGTTADKYFVKEFGKMVIMR